MRVHVYTMCGYICICIGTHAWVHAHTSTYTHTVIEQKPRGLLFDGSAWSTSIFTTFCETYVVLREGRCALAESRKYFNLSLSDIGRMMKHTHTASDNLFDEYIVKDTGRCALLEGSA
jgi:hypothetical protein